MQSGFSNVFHAIEPRQLPFHAPAGELHSCREFVEDNGRLSVVPLAVPAPLVAKQIRRHENMRGRTLPPVVEQIVDVPECERINLAKRPPGGSCDVAVEKRPLRYTATGVGSPAAAFFRPETSRTAPNSALKSSSVSPFSSCSCDKS